MSIVVIKMKFYKYKNIQLTNDIDKANCITHSGQFHVDDVISTIFLSKVNEKIILIRVPSISSKKYENKIIYDIGLGEFDHHQRSRNGQRENGIYYSSIGLLWKKFGKNYLKQLKVKEINKTFEYIDKELVQYINAIDNRQPEYLVNKITPDFVKLCNPEWNENISENEAFINALKLGDAFWNIYIKHAIAEVEAIQIILNQINNCQECYVVFNQEMPYRKAMKIANNSTVRYMIFKSRREGYDVIIVVDSYKYKDKLIKAKDIDTARKISGIEELIYVDVYGQLCCTKTLESAIKLVEYNENNTEK